jgi:hypothetical protein
MAKKSGKKPAKAAPAKIKKTAAPIKLPNVWRLTSDTWQTLWQNKWIFGGIALVYAVLSLILVQGLAGGTDVTSLKNNLNHAFSGNLGSLASALSVFAVLVGSSGNGSSQAAGGYQLSLAIVTSLAVIWALRQVLAGKTIRIRDAYYRGMYPLIPFVLVLLIIGLQLLPFVIGSTLYSLVVTNGIAVNTLERIGWLLLFVATMAWSIYMISSSLFALYIVTLPDMTPLKAVRSARGLVKNRRWAIILRLIFLPVILLVIAAIIMVPVIIVLTVLAKWVFFLLTMLVLVVVHGYIYTLYRELLDE